MQRLSTSIPSSAVTHGAISLLLAATTFGQGSPAKPAVAPVPTIGVKGPAAAVVKTFESTARGTDAPKQKGAPPALAHEFAPDHSRMHYQDADDGLWARGATYKARFASDAVELVPLFGASAPHNVPLALDLIGVTVAGEALDFATVVEPRRAGDVLDYDRGALVERYSASPQSLEQSFVFDSLPQRGELSLRVSFDGAYSAAADADGEAITFASALGNVECRHALALDARGRRLDLPIFVEGSSYRIDVPADFVQGAALPLVVDPSFTVIVIDDTPTDDYLADMAYDLDTDSWRIVYQETVSQTDLDVYSFAVDATGMALPSSGAYVDMSSERWAHPRIANNRASGTFAIVAEAGPVGSRVIKTRHCSATSHVLSATWVVSTNVTDETFHPDIGGDPSSVTPTYFLVTFERAFSAGDHDVLARLLDGGGVPTASVFAVDNTSSTLDESPSISKSNGMPPFADQDWTIVWQRSAAPGDHDIFGARVHWNGTLQNSTFLVTGAILDETNPTVSSPLDIGGQSRRSLMACEVLMAPGEHDIKLSLFSAGVMYDVANLSTMEYFANQDQVEPRVDCDGHQFAVTYAESWQLGQQDYDIVVSYVGPAGDSIELSAPRNWLANYISAERNPGIVAAHSSGASSSRYFAAWNEWNGPERDVFGALIDGPQGGQVYDFCWGPLAPCPCGNFGAQGHGCANSVNVAGALLSATGIASMSNDTIRLDVSGVPVTASCLFFQGTDPMSTTGTPFGDGRKCVGGTILRFPLKGAVDGQASFPEAGDAALSLAGHLPAIGGTRYYQAWYRDPAAYCTSSTFNLSNAIAIDWLP